MADITRGINSAVIFVPLVSQGSGDLVSAPDSAHKIRVWSLIGSITADGTLKFTSGTGPTARTGAMTLKAGGGFGVGAGIVPLFEGGAGEKLSVVLSGGVFDGVLGYTVEAV